MRSILTTVLVCLLLPSVSVAAQSINIKQGIPISSSEQQNPKTAKKDQEKNSNREESLDFSGMGRPGQQTAGESRGSCTDAGRIEALLPVSKSGHTVQGHPSFWVYFSDTFPEGSQVEFIIQNEAREDIWRSRSKLDSKPGYQNFTLPATESPLEIDQWYRWYVKVYCDGQVASVRYVQGWVNRLDLSSRLYFELQENEEKSHFVYGNHGIWYDAINQLISAYHNEPTNLALEQDWQAFVGAKGVDLHLAPSIGSNYEAINLAN